MAGEESILRAEKIYKNFPVKTNRHLTVRAVSDVSLTIRVGEIYGLVGESGCGKSTLGRVISYLIPPTSGKVWLNDTDLSALPKKELRRQRQNIQMVFQDCLASMDPQQRVGDALTEVLRVHSIGDPAQRMSAVIDIIQQVGLRPEHLFRYPHEFSGGQRQRIGLARALLLHPALMVCDEPVSALDVSIQAQILNLLLDLQQQNHHSYLFIAHDISVVKHISDRIGVMNLGHLVEEAETEELFAHTAHPYTKALLSAVPDISKRHEEERIVLKGDLPSPIHAPSGCVFRTRCPYATAACAEAAPELREIAPGHKAACHLCK